MDPLVGYSTAIEVISVMFAAAGIIYGIGYALDQKRLKEFGTNELFEALFGIALIGILAWTFNPSGLLSSMSSYLPSGTQIPGPQDCSIISYNYAICYAMSYLQTVDESASVLLLVALGAYTLIGTLASVKLSFIISIGLNGLNFALGPLSGLIDILITVLILVAAQQTLLIAISPLASNILLPLGLVLRAFFFTRYLGGLFLAAAIGLSIVYPMTFFLNSQIVNSSNISINSVAYKNAINEFNSLSGTAKDLVNMTVPDLMGSPSPSTTFNSIVYIIPSYLNTIDSLFSNIVNDVALYIAELIISTFLLPIADIALTVISIRELSKILGADFQLGRINVLWFSL